MTESELQRAYLYQPFVPVLLGGGPSAAVRMAGRIRRYHGVVCHWFGRRSMPLGGFIKRHPHPTVLSDEALTRMLLDFAREKEACGGFLSLLPCSSEAEAYLYRNRAVLETAFVLLPPPPPSGDPLRGLIAPLAQVRN